MERRGAHGTVYSVKPAQVSKSAQTGEFVGKGAFVIRGQRTWYKDMDVRIGIGIIAVNGVPMVVSGTPDHIQAVCPRYAILSPGMTKKDQLANAIYRNTGLSTDDLLAALPAPATLSTSTACSRHPLGGRMMHEDQRSDGSMWDRRFAETVYAYGKEPNAWLKACIVNSPRAQPGGALSGRRRRTKAVWAASEGWSASVFDLSVEGKKSVSNLLASTEYRSTMTWTISWLETSRQPLRAHRLLVVSHAFSHPEKAHAENVARPCTRRPLCDGRLSQNPASAYERRAKITGLVV